MPWYVGDTLLKVLEIAEPPPDTLPRPFRFPVQWINRPHLDFRGFAGTVVAGSVAPSIITT